MRNIYYYIYFTFAVIISTPTQAQVAVVNAYPNLSFNNPVDIQFTPESNDRVYVAEREGRILVFDNDSTISEVITFLNITEQVDTSGEGGFLGFSFHPEFESNGYFYVYYTAVDSFRSVISRFELPVNSDSADESSELVLLEVDQPETNHNAGQIRFGPDGYLYIALGDGGGSGDPDNNAQDRSTLLGSILRVDVDNPNEDLNYGIPDDNPFAENEDGYREEIYAYGFRNPFRFSFDAETGDLWVGDVGQENLEEVNFVEAGMNYGWNIMEGSQCFEAEAECETAGLEMPVYEYGRSEGLAITGGFLYRGSEIPELYGRYVYADFGSGRIWSFDWDGESASDNQLIETLGQFQLVTFGEDQNQELYIGSFDGNIYKLASESAVSISDERQREDTDDLPTEIRLEQNYPNPFNPTTEISFMLPEASEIDLRVYDILGQEIAVLFTGLKSKGEHSIRFDASDLSGGIYIYSLQSGNTQITRKMTLLK